MKCLCNCPDNQVNAKVARLNALWTLVLAILFIFVWRWTAYILFLDFFIKAIFHPRYSPISRLNSWFLKVLKIKPKFIFAPPKLFAAKVGFVFSAVIIILYLLDYTLAAQIFAGVLALFAFLEFVFEFCMGCWAYEIIQKLTHPSS